MFFIPVINLLAFFLLLVRYTLTNVASRYDIGEDEGAMGWEMWYSGVRKKREKEVKLGTNNFSSYTLLPINNTSTSPK